jgi:hypothetical protein
MAVGVRQAAGERLLSLAGNKENQRRRDDARRGAGDAGERARSQTDAATQVVPALDIKSSGTFSLAQL